jgi:hypothetical protein
MVDPCIKVMESQVKTEVEAAMTYLAMVFAKIFQFLMFIDEIDVNI